MIYKILWNMYIMSYDFICVCFNKKYSDKETYVERKYFVQPYTPTHPCICTCFCPCGWLGVQMLTRFSILSLSMYFI